MKGLIRKEKEIRHNWVLKYEQAQTSHTQKLDMMTHTQKSLDSSQTRINSLLSNVEEYRLQAERLARKSSDQTKELSELKRRFEEANRKSVTYKRLLDRSDEENLAKT